MKFENIVFGESISRSERKGAKIAAPLLRCERCEKDDDNNYRTMNVLRRNRRFIVAMQFGK